MDEARLQALLEQIETWHNADAHQEIIDTIEAIPAEQRGYRLTSLLARAYNNLAQPEDENYHALLERAAALLAPLKSQGESDPLWNFRMGYALFYLDREEEALTYFERAAALEPGDPDTLYFIDECKKYMAQKEYNPEIYEEAHWDAVEEHIVKSFGEYPNVFHEVVSPDIHVDICVIPPSEKHNCYTLVTMGMGAHKMAVPEELAAHKLDRAELLICLPPDWRLDEEALQDETWYWPIRLLKSTARLPGNHDTWLGWGHTVAMNQGETYADNTAFSGVILICPGSFGEDSFVCPLPGGEEVNFYQLLPLYPEEMEYKLSHNADDLLARFPQEWIDIVDITRPIAALDEESLEEDGQNSLMDGAWPHLDSIHEKRLPVEEITAYNHLAIYLRWCMEHGLLNATFQKKYSNVVEGVTQGGKNSPDLRALLRDDEDLNGSLRLSYFNGQGAAFSRWYYCSEDPSHYFPCDIDAHAEAYFGPERYNSPEFQDEAYLFVPWDEAYYQAMAAVMEKRFAQWQEEEGSAPRAEKDFFLKKEQLQPLLANWEGPRACFATDRIMVDGCQVGSCYREEPDQEDKEWDSGWRFMAGDEADGYMEHSDNLGIYDLNTVCNYDPDVMELLNAPFGSYFERDEDGDFCLVDDWDPEEEDIEEESAGVADEAYPFPITLRLNARFQPMHRHELEDILEGALEQRNLGNIDGGGTMQLPTGEIEYCDIEINLRDNAPETVKELIQIINYVGVPKGSALQAEDFAAPVGEQEGLAVYLNGTTLPEEVYASCDINYVIERMDAFMDGIGRMYSYWEGPENTALYFYGESYEGMLAAVQGFLDEYPLCRACVVKKIA